MLMESSPNWFSKDYGFNTKAFFWYGKVLIDLNVCDEWYKEFKKLNKQLVG